MPLDMARYRMIKEGRTSLEALDWISSQGNLARPQDLLKRLFWSLGIPEPREKAENLVLFGCYNPYRIPHSLQRYLKLLDRLAVEYTYLPMEYCCAVPTLEAAQGRGLVEEARIVEKASKDFMGKNIAAGRDRGAKNIIYFCVWCTHLGKRYFPDNKNQFYFLDHLIPKLENLDLRLEPKVIGYYEGCHLRNRQWAPGIELDWPSYRRILDRVSGLKVVDLNPKTCCVVNPTKIIEDAEKFHLDTIVSPCPACHMRLIDVARGRIRMLFLSDLLFEAADPS